MTKSKRDIVISVWIASGRGIIVSSIGPSIDEINSYKDAKTLDQFLKQMGISVIYLDVYRDGILVPSYKLKHIKEYFLKLGYEIRGGITLGTYDPNFQEANVTREGINGSEVCWTSQLTQEGFKFLAIEVAQTFDFVLYDDTLFPSCLCWRCLKNFNELYKHDLKAQELDWMFERIYTLPKDLLPILNDWQLFQRNLYREVATKYIINPSREVNPNVRLVVKVPQWNEYFPNVGYDIEMLKEIFDEVWVGTEIREDLQPVGYFAYANAEFVRKRCNYSSIGTWFDTYRGYTNGSSWDPVMGPETYLEQARMSVLAKAKEIMLFSLGDLRHHTRQALVNAFIKELPTYKKIALNIENKHPLGIGYLKASDSVASAWRGLGLDRYWGGYQPRGDLYFNAVLGSIGIPLVTITDYHELKKKDTIIITQNEIIKAKKESDWNVVQFIKDGGRAILTSEALSAIYSGHLGNEGYEFLGVDIPLSGSNRFIDDAKEFVVKGDKKIKCKIPLTVGPILQLKEDYTSITDLIYNNTQIPIMYYRKYGLGKIIYLPITYPIEQFRFGCPTEIKQTLREFLGQYSGIYVNSNKDRLSLIVYTPDIVAVENFNNEPISIEVVLIDKVFSRYKVALDIVANIEIPVIFRGNTPVISIDIDKRSLAVFKLSE